MAGPLKGSWNGLKALMPNWLTQGKLELNFIVVHYLYMIGLSILGSIVLYPGSGIKYIDALFFASGAATQSGLNTIDINKLFLYQQITLYFMACVANPIFINTVVVFIRLYWFEKRFQHIVSEARKSRQTRTRSRTASEMRQDLDPGRVERGVAGRSITVLHDTTKPNGMTQHARNGDDNDQSEKEALEHLAKSLSNSPLDGSSNSDTGESSNGLAPDETPATYLGQPPTLKRDITFADELRPEHRRHHSSLERIPEVRNNEHHIAFIEKQRKHKDTGTLRIPGPRDFDRGDVPRELDSDEEDNELNPTLTRNTVPSSPVEQRGPRPQSSTSRAAELNQDDHPVRRGITIDEPERPQRDRAGTGSTHTRFNPLHPWNRLQNQRSQGPSTTGLRQRAKTLSFSKSQAKDVDPMPYLSWQPTIGRNSAFIDLTEEQREELGGIEYRSLKTLAIILVAYFLGFHVLGVIILVPWIVKSGTWGPIVTEDGVNRVWWGIFTPASMFNDLGFTLTPDSMVSFQLAVLPLLLGSFLIIIGNTGFPCMLRFVIWTLSKLVPVGSGIYEELRFLLDHPRRCFTLMFPSNATWWLTWVLIILNGLDLIFFIILDLHDPTVTTLSPGYRVLNGLFQAASTRTAGFACVNLAELHPAIQVSYLIMMYISIFPIAISVRRTNVYEEKSLGIFGGEEEGDEEGRSYVGQHLRRQLSFDLWYVFLGFFIIAIVEGNRLQNTNDYAFTMFSCLFEIVSAYGTVGLSLGYPTINASFSAEFKVISKLVIVAMMLRGRHRGLPYALDRAILLPSESLHKKEVEEAAKRAVRRASIATTGEDGEGRPPMNGDSGPGFPRYHTNRSGLDDGGNETGLSRMRTRRMSEVSAFSGRNREGWDLGRMISGALSAGPTNRKYD